jgi:hypothetical protein
LVLSAGRSRQRDHTSGILRDSILALLASWGSPFVPAGTEGSSGASGSSSSSSKLEASGQQMEDWLLQVSLQTIFRQHVQQIKCAQDAVSLFMFPKLDVL